MITRRCLEVFLNYRNPVTIITKNELVTRDLDILEKLAALDLVHVNLSVTSLDPDLAGVMEPVPRGPGVACELWRSWRNEGSRWGL